MKKLTILGAGSMGLAVAIEAQRKGYEVTVLEGDSVPGGMAAHFDLDGISIERFYHFICKSDRPLFEMLEELGVSDILKWRTTQMGYFIEGQLYPWGDPLSLLRFPLLNLWQKVRYGCHAFFTSRGRSFSSIDNLDAKKWLRKWLGEESYKLLWQPLLDLKFYEFANDISASWIATRIRRIGRSRKSLLTEELGYLEGGSEALIQAMVQRIEENGGTICLREPALEVSHVDDHGSRFKIRTPKRELESDLLVSTIPTPFVSTIFPFLGEPLLARYEDIKNIGVVCVICKLNERVSKNFWVNINDSEFTAPGVIEFSNLRQLDGHVVYIPYYLPQDNELFSKADEYFVDQAKKQLKTLNTALSDDSFEQIKVSRLKYAQPVCEPGFGEKLPAIKTPVEGLFIADTCFYYPEDRGISESIDLGRSIARALE